MFTIRPRVGPVSVQRRHMKGPIKTVFRAAFIQDDATSNAKVLPYRTEQSELGFPIANEASFSKMNKNYIPQMKIPRSY